MRKNDQNKERRESNKQHNKMNYQEVIKKLRNERKNNTPAFLEILWKKLSG
jgi:hypothetical protein